MYKSFSLDMPDCSKNSFKSFPALPTNGVPVKSSFAPGASPTRIYFALSGFPSENTIFVLVLPSSHLWQF